VRCSQISKETRPAGLEPATFGFEVHDVASKHSNDKYLKPVFLRQKEVNTWLTSEQIKNICFLKVVYHW